ncbi:unnamed protein product [Calypogeia fissa]
MSEAVEEVDAVVVGAGFSGIYMLYKLRELGLSAKGFETGSDVGGTWYWNCYPGARCDVQSIEYCYSFSPEVSQEWTWSDRFASHSQIQGYLKFVADRLDLRRYITFNARVKSMVYDDTKNRWTVRTDSNEAVMARFCITAAGCISIPVRPNIPGLDKYSAGPVYHTGRWPHEPVDFTGKRVGIVGTGSTAMQLVPELAKQAAELYVFQRTPNHAIPANNFRFSDTYSKRIKQRYEQLWKKWIVSPSASSFNTSSKSALDVTEEERDSTFESAWNIGGFEILFSFEDLLVDKAANDTVADFCRKKIKQIVKDQTVAEQLLPGDHPLGSKRICLSHGYYEAFNLPNVHLVSAQVEPIVEIEEKGVRTSKELYKIDSLILATGFDTMTGSLLAMDVRGRGGVSLREEWAKGASTYLGLGMAGFPNLFTLTGPGSPTVLNNMPRCVEQHVDWVGKCISYMSTHHIAAIEPTTEAQTAWMNLVTSIAEQTLFSKGKSWYNGDNIEGKPRQFLPFVGFAYYQTLIDKVANENYEGYIMRPETAPA